MLNCAHEKFPQVPIQRMGLREMRFPLEIDGAVCMDALETIPPEDWPVVMSNFYQSIKPRGYFYFTVEFTTQEEIDKAFADGQKAGLPIDYGEWAYKSGDHGDFLVQR